MPRALAVGLAIALAAGDAQAAEEGLADVLPPTSEEPARGPLEVVMQKTKRFEAGASIRGARGLLEAVGQGRFADELAHGRAALRVEAAAGVGTTGLAELRDAVPIFDVTARATVRELPVEETTSTLTLAASRQVQPGFSWETGSATLAIGAVPRSFFRLGAGYTFALSRVTGPAPPPGAGECDACLLSMLDEAASLDLTDPLPPHGGVKVRLDLTQAGGPLGGDYGFVRASPLVVGTVPLSDRVELAGRVRLGVLVGDAPVYERFFAGGPASIRSYGYNQLSPYARAANGGIVPVGGSGLLLASVEVRVRLPSIPHVKAPLGAAVFVDAARVSVAAADLLAGPPSVAIGAGLHAGTPIGHLRVELGISAYSARPEVVGPGVTPPRLPPYAVQLATGEAF